MLRYLDIIPRLDTIQAAVANYKMKNKLDNITNKRIRNSKIT